MNKIYARTIDGVKANDEVFVLPVRALLRRQTKNFFRVRLKGAP
jgi:hypothetical protein